MYIFNAGLVIYLRWIVTKEFIKVASRITSQKTSEFWANIHYTTSLITIFVSSFLFILTSLWLIYHFSLGWLHSKLHSRPFGGLFPQTKIRKERTGFCLPENLRSQTAPMWASDQSSLRDFSEPSSLVWKFCNDFGFQLERFANLTNL